MQSILVLLLSTVLLISCSGNQNGNATNKMQEIEAESEKNNDGNIQVAANTEVDNSLNEQGESGTLIDSSTSLDNNTSANLNEQASDLENTVTNWETSSNTDASSNSGNTNETTWGTTTNTTTNNEANWENNETDSNTNDLGSTSLDVSTNTEELIHADATTSHNISNASGGSGFLLVVNTTGYVDDADKVKVVEAIKGKWFQERSVQQLDKDTYNNTIEQYEGSIVLVAEIVRGYGEYEITVRTATIHKYEDGYIGEKPLKNWSARGIQTTESLIKEIKYADDVFSEK